MDAIAKCAARHRQVQRESIKAFKADKRNYMELARLAGKVMAKIAEERPWKKEGKRWQVYGEERSGKVARSKHELYEDNAGTTWCLHCPQRATTAASKLRLKHSECKGPLQNRIAKEWGHQLMVSKDVGGEAATEVIWCTRCGAYAEQAARGMVK